MAVPVHRPPPPCFSAIATLKPAYDPALVRQPGRRPVTSDFITADIHGPYARGRVEKIATPHPERGSEVKAT